MAPMPSCVLSVLILFCMCHLLSSCASPAHHTHQKQVSSELFLASFLGSLLQLAKDVVPNIRVAVARLCQQRYPKWLNTDARVQAALAMMQADADRDVTWFARSSKARDEAKFCDYSEWVPREEREKRTAPAAASEQGTGAAQEKGGCQANGALDPRSTDDRMPAASCGLGKSDAAAAPAAPSAAATEPIPPPPQRRREPALSVDGEAMEF